MIDIKRKEECVGCNACVQACPKQCISFNNDEQGFSYPLVNINLCIDCGLCEKVCPVIYQYEPKIPKHVYAGWNVDEKVRITSSSGGIFYALAKKTIDEDGVVFGARFNEKWEVIHSYGKTLDEIKAFKGSKYVQSRIGRSYFEAKEFLKSGRKVLFSGTPCQIAGLRRFLRKDYKGLLLTVDVVCHGVPSPGIWREYLNFLTLTKEVLKNSESQSYSMSLNDISFIKDISFRDKMLGWEKFGISIRYANSQGCQNSESQSTRSQTSQTLQKFEYHRDNLYLQGFLKDIYLRPSCYECPSKCGKSHSDITLADFWGIQTHHPELHSDKGVSLVMINNQQGEDFISNTNIKLFEATYKEAIKGNPAIIRSSEKSIYYDYFWELYNKYKIKGLIKTLNKMKPSIIRRLINKVKRAMKSVWEHN